MALLKLEHVAKCYRRGSRVALDDVSLAIEPGRWSSCGASMSGRSTLLRIAAGIETPDDGLVRFDGRDLAERVRREARRRDQLRPPTVPLAMGFAPSSISWWPAGSLATVPRSNAVEQAGEPCSGWKPSMRDARARPS